MDVFGAGSDVFRLPLSVPRRLLGAPAAPEDPSTLPTARPREEVRKGGAAARLGAREWDAEIDDRLVKNGKVGGDSLVETGGVRGEVKDGVGIVEGPSLLVVTRT